MHDVDFLPPKYRDLSARRNIKLSRFVVVGAIAVALVGAALMQLHMRRQLTAEIESVMPLHNTAELHSRDLKATQEQLDNKSKLAQLVTYLQHPWPRTQLLAAVIEPLPESMSLDQISISKLKLDVKKAATKTTRRKRKTKTRAQAEAEADKLTPAQRDLKHLRMLSDASHTVIIVTGRTSDRAALYYYLARLGESDLIIKAELQSLETASDRRSSGRRQASANHEPPSTAKFVARLVIERGHGQVDPANENSQLENT
jgi:hypothetical protein